MRPDDGFVVVAVVFGARIKHCAAQIPNRGSFRLVFISPISDAPFSFYRSKCDKNPFNYLLRTDCPLSYSIMLTFLGCNLVKSSKFIT